MLDSEDSSQSRVNAVWNSKNKTKMRKLRSNEDKNTSDEVKIRSSKVKKKSDEVRTRLVRRDPSSISSP